MPLPTSLQRAIDGLFNQPGETESSLRRMVLERNRTGSGELPNALRDFVDKIAHQPWTLTDQDFARLKTAGYSDGQLYEITMAAALGAGLKRFDAGVRAIEDAS